MEPFPVGVTILCLQFGESGARPDRNHMITNNPCGQFAAFQGHQHSATRERIDERGRIPNRQESGCRRHRMPSEAFQRNRQPRRARTRMRECIGRTAVLTDDFAHHTLCVRSTFAYLARRGDKAKIAETVFNTAQPTVATAIKIDLASAGRDASVFQMGFESDQRRTMRFRFVPGLTNPTSQGPRSSRGIDRHRRTVTDFASIAFHNQPGNPIFLKKQIPDVCIFQDSRAGIARATQQLLVHLGAAKPSAMPVAPNQELGTLTLEPLRE